MEEKLIKKILDIEKKINKEYVHLIYLSINDEEESNEFHEHLLSLNDSILEENDLCDSLDITTVRRLVYYLDTNEEKFEINNVYERCYDLLSRKLEQLELDEELEDEEIYENSEIDDPTIDYEIDEDELDELELFEELDEFNEEEMELGYEEIIDEYYEEYESYLDKYYDMALARIYIKALKKMNYLLNTTKTSSKFEENYSKNLRKYFKNFKYNVFSMNGYLEKLSLLYSFGVDKIPDFEELEIDITPIYYNRALLLVEELANKSKRDTSLSNVSESLFLTLCFEELIEYLDSERLDKVKSFCNEIHSKYYYYNNYESVCLEKIKIREGRM